MQIRAIIANWDIIPIFKYFCDKINYSKQYQWWESIFILIYKKALGIDTNNHRGLFCYKGVQLIEKYLWRSSNFNKVACCRHLFSIIIECLYEMFMFLFMFTFYTKVLTLWKVMLYNDFDVYLNLTLGSSIFQDNDIVFKICCKWWLRSMLYLREDWRKGTTLKTYKSRKSLPLKICRLSLQTISY